MEAVKLEQKSKTLTEIIEDFRKVLHSIDDLDGEVTPELEEQLTAAEGTLKDKVERCLWVSKEALAQAEVYVERARVLEDRARVLKAQKARLEQYVLGALLSLDVRRVETDHFVATVAQTPWAVRIEDPEVFTSKHKDTPFVRVKLEPAKVPVKEALMQGTEVEGASLGRSWALRVK